MDKSVLGFFRCQHCDTLLKQRKIMGLFFVFEKKMWAFFILLLALTVFLPEAIISFFEAVFPAFTEENKSFLPLISLLATIIPVMGVMFSMMSRYSVFDEVPEEALEAEPEMDKTGQNIFLVFLIITLLVAIGLFYFIDFSVMNPWLSGGIFMVFLAAVIAAGIWIMNRFKEQPSNS